jgi:hypothetical protein
MFADFHRRHGGKRVPAVVLIRTGFFGFAGLVVASAFQHTLRDGAVL